MEFCEILRKKALTLDTQPAASMIAMQSLLKDHLIPNDSVLIETLPFYAARCFSQQAIKTLQGYSGSMNVFAIQSLHETSINPKCIFVGTVNKQPTVSVLRYCLEDWMEGTLNPFKLQGHPGSSYLPEMSDDNAEAAYAEKAEQEKALKETALFSTSAGWKIITRFMQLAEELLRKQFTGCVNDIHVHQQNVDYYNLNTSYIRADFLG